MTWGGPTFILALVAISTLGWIITSWIRARHGYPVENEWGGTAVKLDENMRRQNELLAAENERLKSQVLRVEERVAVLERIATEPGTRITREIESLK